MSAETEQAMIEAIAAHARAEGHRVDGLHALEVRMVSPAYGDPAAGRLYYRMGATWASLAILQTPWPGAPGISDAPQVRAYTGLTGAN